MALFEVPQRANKSLDKTIAKKSVSKSSRSTTIIRGNSILDKISIIQANVNKNLGKYADESMVIDTIDSLHTYLSKCVNNYTISIDTETTGLDPLTDKIVGLCIYTPNEKTAYIPINHVSYVTGLRVDGQLTEAQVKSELEWAFSQVYLNVIMFNAAFDMRVIKNQLHFDNIHCDWDAYLASRILNENEQSNSLKPLYAKYVLQGKEDAFKFDDLFKGISFAQVPIKTAYLYAAHDAKITYELAEFQKKYLVLDSDREDMKRLAEVFLRIEMPCVKVVAEMEDSGITFNTRYANELSEKYHKLLDKSLQKFYNILSKYNDKIEDYKSKNINSKLDNPINISSPLQIAILLYDILKIKPADKKNPRGTGVDILQKINNPICNALLEYRTIEKLLSTYIDKLPNCVNANDGRIHCKYNQYGADTGRFSSSDPNLQNIPSHNKDIRKMFCASKGYVLMSSDYSQQEPKVMTQMCKDPAMIKAYNEGKDLYAQIASLAFNKSYEDCLEFRPDGTTNSEGKERRSQAKSILLGVLYGRGIDSIAEQLNVSKQKAQQIKDSVFKGFPAIPQFEKDSLKMAKELGYVTTLWGRKRRLPVLQLPDYEFEYVSGHYVSNDILDFSDEYETMTEVPESIRRIYISKLNNSWGSAKQAIIKDARERDGIIITDNTLKKSDAMRQVVNSRIQGSAADMSKKAMILVGNDERLKQLGFRLLIPVHDELIGECPIENAAECKERFSYLMSIAAEDKLTIPIKCDVTMSYEWYGEEIVLCNRKITEE